jgi:hypothetical protein
MTPTYGEIIRELGDGWAVAWDATDIPADVRDAFADAVRDEQAKNAELRNAVSAEADPVSAEADPVDTKTR